MNRRRIFILGIIIIIAILFWYSNVIQSSFYLIVDFFNEVVLYNHLLAIILFILISALAALISPFTNIPLVPVAVVVWGTYSTILLLFVGWLIGDIIAYAIGRYFGNPVISYLVSEKKLESLEKAIKERSSFFSALFLRLMLPAELGYVFGIIRYNFLLYLIITFLAELPFAIISTHLSDAALSGETLKFFEIAVGLLVVSFILFKIFSKKHNEIAE